ncbi:hypothetical protein CASFOL_041416 [Castilleja foliolosa]|uniref:Uncharacterized protein n=1 Tax=Castilleja foliolosa TaxID=1961234 RepID=A0ABD3BBY1_9LAMI
MGACASKFKEFKDGVPPPAEKEEVVTAERDVKIVEAMVNKEEAATAKEVKLVEETVSKDEVPAAAEDGEAKPRSLGHLLKEVEGEKDSTENGNAKFPEPVAADAEAKGKDEKAPSATDDVKPSNPVEKKTEGDVKPDSENLGVEVSEKKTEEKSLAETEKKKTEEEPTETTKLEAPTETIKHEAKNAEVEKKIEDTKLAEDTKKETEASEKITEEKSLAETEKKKPEDEPTETTKLETPTEIIKFEAKNAEAEKTIEDTELAEDTKIETESSEKITEEKSLAETEKKKTEEQPTEITKLETQTETTKLETPTETIKHETKDAEEEKKNGENKLAVDPKIETPAKVEEDDKHIDEPTIIESCGKQQSTEVKPVSDAEKPKDGEDETKN